MLFLPSSVLCYMAYVHSDRTCGAFYCFRVLRPIGSGEKCSQAVITVAAVREARCRLQGLVRMAARCRVVRPALFPDTQRGI